jgi:hypothetical protein
MNSRIANSRGVSSIRRPFRSTRRSSRFSVRSPTCEHLVLDPAPRRQHQHAQLRIERLDPPQHAQPVHLRQVQIQDQQLELALQLQHLERSLAVMHNLHKEALFAQLRPQKARQRNIVVDDQDAASG